MANFTERSILAAFSQMRMMERISPFSIHLLSSHASHITKYNVEIIVGEMNVHIGKHENEKKLPYTIW